MSKTEQMPHTIYNVWIILSMGWILNTILPRQSESTGGFIACNQPVSSMDDIKMGHFFGTIGMTIACDRLKNQAARVLIHSDIERYVHSGHVP